MALIDQLGAVDPIGVASGLIADAAPDLVQNDTVDPISVANRLIRKSLDSRQQRALQKSQNNRPESEGASVDFAAFGDPNASAEPPQQDFSAFGQTEDEIKPQPKDEFRGYAPTAARAFGKEFIGSAVEKPLKAAGIASNRFNEAVTQSMEAGVDPTTGMPMPPVDMRGPDGSPRKPAPIKENPLYRGGEAVKEFSDRAISPLTPTEQNSVTGRVAGGLGGFAGMVPGMVAGGAVGGPAGAIAAGAGMMAASSGSAAYDDAIAKGADDATAAKAAGLNAIVGGALGALPLGVILAPFRATAPGLVGLAATALEKALRAGAVFATVGEAQEYVGQQIAKALYDPNAGYSPDAKRIISSLISGGIIGAATPPYRAPGATTAAAAAAPGATAAAPGALPGGGPTAGTGAGASAGAGPGAGPGPQGFRTSPGGPGGPTPGSTPPPFQTAMRPKLRTLLEAKAAYYKEHSPADIASWSDDQLKQYVNTKFGGGSAKSEGEEPEAPAAEKPKNYKPMDEAEAESTLREFGYSDEDLGPMGADTRRATAEMLRTAYPDGPPKGAKPKPERAGNGAQPEAMAPDQPSAEPLADLKAQLSDLHDPAHPRAAVWLPKTSVEHLSRFGLSPETLKGSPVIQDFDGQGGVLIARDQEVAQQAVADLDKGVPLQTVVGKLTGAGEGKPADATHVVQQLDKDGNVTQERGVREADVAKTKKEFSAEGRTVQVVSPEDAIKRRAERVAAEGADGTRSNPIEIKSAADVARAAGRARTDHSHAQGEANNVQRGHIKWNGGEGEYLEGTIEVAAGGTRKGLNPKTGKPWETTHTVPYGDWKNTEAADGMRTDFYLGPEPNAGHPVYVLDEKDHETGKFRQPKTFVGFPSSQAAVEAYLGTSTKKPEHMGGMRALSVPEFKAWLKSGGGKAPLSEAMTKDTGNKVSNETGTPGGADQAMADLASMFNEATPEHHAAVETAIKATGHDPARVRPADITTAAELIANNGMSPEKAFMVAVAHNLIADGTIKFKDAEKVLGHEAATELLEAGGHSGERQPPAEAAGAATGGPAAEAPGELGPVGTQHGEEVPARTGPISETHGGERPGEQESSATTNPTGAEAGRGAVGEAAGGERNAETDERGNREAGKPAGEAGSKPEHQGGRTAEGAVKLAHALVDLLKAGKSIPHAVLQQEATQAYGGTLAEGKFDRKDAHDALELAVNLIIKSDPDYRAVYAGWQRPMQQIEKLLARLPTQRVRSEEQQSFQQFSTPPNYSLAAVYAANIRDGETVLEPSAGTGSLVAAAVRPDVKIIANELSERRAPLLHELVGKDGRVFTENAEQIDNILPDDVKPTVVVMNPPFSQTAGRMGDRKMPMVAAEHIEAALNRLEPGGRLVAIVGKGMAMGAPTYRGWWEKISKNNTVQANVGVEGKVYEKYGTTFGTRLVVIDKVQPVAGHVPVLADAQTVDDLMRALEPIRNGRAEPKPSGTAAERQPAEQSSAPLPAAGAGERAAPPPASAESGDVGVGEPGDGRVAEPGPGGAAEPGGKPVRLETGERARLDHVEPERPAAVGAGERTPASASGSERSEASSGAGVEHDLQPATGGQPGTAAGSERVELEQTAKPGTQAKAEISDSLYDAYEPQRVRVKGAKPHPGPLVQSAAMASVAPPTPKYQPRLPKAVIDEGKLSIAQLEAVIYAGQAHQVMLPAGESQTPKRRGFFIGDGTGVGKGREVAGIILDNWQQGRTKAVWVSEKKTLLQDAKRDWSGLGGDGSVLFDVGKVKAGEPVKAQRGIGFITYDTLKGGISDQAAIARGQFIRKQRVSVNGQPGAVQRIQPQGRNNPPLITVKLENGTEITVPGNEVNSEQNIKVKSRVDQLVDWFGKDFDGVIAFDEAHNMGNATDIKGERGQKDAAQKAVAGMQLQDRLPNARVVYVSATGATEVSNLAYVDRLGLWGRGTAFASQAKFVSEVEKGGIAAMELIARDMKQLGLYTARNLSYDGVEYERLEHKLDTNQREIYDTLAEAWQVVLRNINAALEATGGNLDSRAKSAAMSAFWGGHQRFFNQVITSLQMPSVIKAVEKDIAAGRQVVLQLTNTNEASQERAAAKAKTAEEIEDLDITPRDQIIQLVENSFPTQEYEQYVDENGKEQSRPVTDKDGNPVQNKQALRMREALIDKLASVRVPQGPLDMVLDHFGTDVVAEVTGRGRRFVMAADEKTGQRRRMEETRPGSANLSETDAFQSGQKKALIFSEAGGTGRSYHADNTSASKDARRVHYLVQGGWRADKAVQGFGRTHRTNQASAPVFKLVTTDLQGQKRFISSIARRLGQLGALTKGERKAGDQGVFTARDNLESAEARQALQQFFHDLLADGVQGVPLVEFEQQTGLKLRTQDDEGRVTSIKQDLPPITQFLNRLLSLKVDMQNRVFEAFSDRLDAVIEARAQAGLLDVGLETIRADKIAKESERLVHTVEESKAETKYVKLRLSDRFTPIDFDTIADNKSRKVLFFARSPKDKVYAVAEAPSVTDDNGNIVDHYRIINPVSGGRIIPRNNINQSEGKWVKIDKSGARKLWDKEVEAAPEFVSRDLHLITGAILPVWDRLGGMARVVRLQTDDGERLLGRVVPSSDIAGTLKKLGVEAAASKINPEKLFDSLMAGGRATLANGWTLGRRMVAHEHRIELSGPSSFSEGNEVKQDGVFTERIDYKVRYFVPTDPVEGKKVLAAITKYRPVAEMESGGLDEEELGAAMGRPTPTTAFRPIGKAIPPELIPQESGFTREFELRQTEIAQHLMKLIHRITGPRIAVRFRDEIHLSQSAPGWGNDDRGARTIGGAYLPLSDIIRIALADHRFPDKATVAFHESWHAVEDHFATDQEMALLKREEPRLREAAARFYGLKPEQLSGVADFEIRAMAFQAYAADREAGGRGNGFHIGVRRLFERLMALFRQIANYLKGLGFHTAEDVFGKAYEGQMKERLSRKLDEGKGSRIAEQLLAEKAKTSARAEEPRAAMAATPEGEGNHVTLGFLGNPEQLGKTFKEFWTSTFQPELFSDRALEADPLFARYKASSAQEKDAVIRQSESEWEYWNKRSDAERIRFIDDVETAGFGNIPPDPVQAGMARRYRRMLDANWAEEQRYGSKAAFVEDYFPHIWESPDEWRAYAKARSEQVGPTWFQKKRTIDYITDGLAAGLKLKYTNPVDILVHRLMSGVDMRQRMELLYKLKEMGLAWEGEQGGEQLVRRGWRSINAPDRKQWVIAPDVQLLWKNGVEAKGLWQAEHAGGSMFRGWMALKNVWIPVKLALSAFHPLHVMHIDQANSLALGWDELTKGHDLNAALKAVGEGLATLPTLGMIHYRKGAEARAAWAKRPSQQYPEQKAMVALMTDGGFVPQLSEQLKIGAQRQLAEAWQKIQRKEAGVADWRRFVSAAMRRPIEKLQAPIFEKWIPALKAAAYLNQTAALLKRNPHLLTDHTARRLALRTIAKSVDNRFGEMFYGNLFWNRYLKDAGIGSFLSLGWNLGFAREFGGAATEAVTRPASRLPPFNPSAPRKVAREASNKIAFAIAYLATASLLAGAISMAMDDEHGLPSGLDFVFPRIGGKNPDGSPRRITTMFYNREAPMLMKHVQEAGGWLSGMGEMLWNKLLFEPFHELLNNRDYYGYNIWDENAPVYKQVWQALTHTIGEQTNPMSVSGAKHAAELSGKPFPSLWEAIQHPGKLIDALTAKGVGLSILGFGPAPAYVEKTPTQNRIARLYREHVAPASRPQEEGENTREKMAVRSAILIAKRDQDSKALQEAYAKGKAIGMTPKSMQNVGVTPTDIYLFSRLPNADQKAILDHASPDERKRYLPKAHLSVKVEMNRNSAAQQ